MVYNKLDKLLYSIGIEKEDAEPPDRDEDKQNLGYTFFLLLASVVSVAMVAIIADTAEQVCHWAGISIISKLPIIMAVLLFILCSYILAFFPERWKAKWSHAIGFGMVPGIVTCCAIVLFVFFYPALETIDEDMAIDINTYIEHNEEKIYQIANWETLPEEEKVSLMYFVAGYYVKADMISPTRIVVAEVDDEQYVASYVDGFNTIILRKDLLQDVDFTAALYAVMHEIAHAHERKSYDDYYYRNKDFAERFLPDAPPILEVLEEMHTTPYVDYKDDPEGYHAQKTEVYADRFAYQETFLWEFLMDEIASEHGINMSENAVSERYGEE